MKLWTVFIERKGVVRKGSTREDILVVRKIASEKEGRDVGFLRMRGSREGVHKRRSLIKDKGYIFNRGQRSSICKERCNRG